MRSRPRARGPVEEYAIVLDYLELGYPDDPRPTYRRTPIAQVVGKDNFMLLEVVPKKGIRLVPQEQVYIGSGKREKVHHVLGKIPFSKLTPIAKDELFHALKSIVKEKEQKFIEFVNKAQPISIRVHSLELLPHIGKKHMWKIVEERESKPFESFQDLKERAGLPADPIEIFAERILQELQGGEKHYLFVRPFQQQR